MSPKPHPKPPPAVTHTPVREPGLFQGEFLQELVPVLQELPHVGLHQGDADALLPATGSPVHTLLVVVVHQACKHSSGLLGSTHTQPLGGFLTQLPISPVGNAGLASSKNIFTVWFEKRFGSLNNQTWLCIKYTSDFQGGPSEVEPNRIFNVAFKKCFLIGGVFRISKNHVKVN